MLQTTIRPGHRMTAGLQQAIGLLSLSDAGLAARLAVEAARNPALRVVLPDLPGWRRPLLDPEGLTAPPDSLYAHVLRRIAGLGLDARGRAIALALTDALEATGWLGKDPAVIARVCGVELAELESVLARLQRIEPGGLFARSLAECLRLQLEVAGEMTPTAAAVLENLPRLAATGVAGLAGTLALPVDEVARAVGLVRGLDPKPGLAFGDAGPPPQPPDLELTCGPDGWIVRPGDGAVSVTVRRGQGDPAAANAIRHALARRAALSSALALRLADVQTAWLEGRGGLCPVTARELAQAEGVHVATVNRVLSALTLRGPRGILPLRGLVSRPLRAGGPAAAEVRRRLAAILDAAGGARPSDARLVEMLAAEGIEIARRTVTKYRRDLSAAP